jgi:hypothetical protein
VQLNLRLDAGRTKDVEMILHGLAVIRKEIGMAKISLRSRGLHFFGKLNIAVNWSKSSRLTFFYFTTK